MFCDRCLANNYMNPNQQCVECMTGAVCDEQGVTLANMATKFGYYRFEASAVEVYGCPTPLNCIGGSLLNTSRGGCGVGADGPLCSQCM
jgi:hypothetical protein